jgi:hypothetical protein
MSWKASLLGAVLVVAAGLAVGVAIGGKTTTRTDTVTVVRKVKVSVPPPTTTTTAVTTTAVTTPTSTTATTPSNTTSSKTASLSGNSDEEYLTDYLESQGGAEALNHNSENAAMDTIPTQRELEGQTYPHAVAFDLNEQGVDGRLTASYQIPTPGFTKLTSNAVGLQTSSNASTIYHLVVYKNEDSSPDSIVLYQADFRGPSTVHKMSIAIQGATDLLFVWTHKAREPEEGSTFVLADPVLTGES